MQNDDTNRPSKLKLNRETLRTLTQAGPVQPQKADKSAPPPDMSCATFCCTKRGCIVDES